MERDVHSQSLHAFSSFIRGQKNTVTTRRAPRGWTAYIRVQWGAAWCPKGIVLDTAVDYPCDMQPSARYLPPRLGQTRAALASMCRGNPLQVSTHTCYKLARDPGYRLPACVRLAPVRAPPPHLLICVRVAPVRAPHPHLLVCVRAVPFSADPPRLLTCVRAVPFRAPPPHLLTCVTVAPIRAPPPHLLTCVRVAPVRALLHTC
jgi:hypothetical protein